MYACQSQEEVGDAVVTQHDNDYHVVVDDVGESQRDGRRSVPDAAHEVPEARAVQSVKVVMVCSCSACVDVANEVLGELRPIVRQSTGTVLIRTVPACSGNDCVHSGAGAMIRLQVCTDRLRPIAPPTLVGPLRGRELDAVMRWLQEH